LGEIIPTAPLRPCSSPGCPNLVAHGYCPTHRTGQHGNSRERGYDTAWDKLRKVVRAEEPLCRMCLAVGMIEATRQVDHIVPFRGLDDPLRLDRSNLQGLCATCHGRKTMGSRRAYR
jgi:5-methylcytosine-specific restriction enzyme A